MLGVLWRSRYRLLKADGKPTSKYQTRLNFGSLLGGAFFKVGVALGLFRAMIRANFEGVFLRAFSGP